MIPLVAEGRGVTPPVSAVDAFVIGFLSCFWAVGGLHLLVHGL